MRFLPLVAFVLSVFQTALVSTAAPRPNIIFVMADDMGWGQTGYNGNPVLKTPHLDAMAASGLRFDRFYAAAPVCSPTRASVLTGRAGERTGVPAHGYPLRTQEKTVAQALRSAGYATAHFGKWHLNGLRGPGVPLLSTDPLHPGVFGFDEWLTTSNFFDIDPLLSRQGVFEPFQGDSSEIVVAEALSFARRQHEAGRPFFAVIWYGTPHDPFRASDSDRAAFAHLPEASAHHYGELVAMDRSIGALRHGLRELGVSENTLVVFCSDNGGLAGIEPGTVGGLRGHKGSVYEGGLRVPGIIEWPARITTPRVTDFPASTSDLFPTLVDLLGLSRDVLIEPVDGESLVPLFSGAPTDRTKPLAFRFLDRGAIIERNYKLVSESLAAGIFRLYDLGSDPGETTDRTAEHPGIASRLRQTYLTWIASVDASVAGLDYPERSVNPPSPEPIPWAVAPQYEPFLDEWRHRWEYQRVIDNLRRPSESRP